MDLGYGNLDREQTRVVYEAFTRLADTRKGLTDADIADLLEELGFRRAEEVVVARV